jgi:flagellar biosynthetic protein FlhB
LILKNSIAKIFGFFSLIEGIKVTIKCCIFFAVIYFILKNGIQDSMSYYFLDSNHYIAQMGMTVFHLLLAMCIAAVVIGGGDYAFNLWKNEKSLRMGKQEIKEEIKKHEGDPLVKSQRKRMARDLVLRKSIQAVPKATFIVTNPEHFAVAIRYVRGMSAPILVAKGQDFLALKIREIAKAHDIIIVENKPLARTIYKTMKIGQEVPSSLYQSIIEVMKYIHKMKGRSYFENRE